MNIQIKLAVAALVALGCQTKATVIQFESISTIPAIQNYDPIPAGYGSTAQVDVSYLNASYWGPGYATLKAVAYPSSDGSYTEITLTPKPGQSVTLIGFDMGAYPTGSGNRAEQEISISYGINFLNYGPINLNGVAPTHFSPGVSSTGPITIRFGSDWDNGINNIEFEAFSAVPEPSTYIAGLSALGMLGLFGWRNRK